ncbi:MAG: hypothetical protein IV090_00925 [Candidatus Sericytochromatia bacterium]|nr:hypothetical protein [Candidatus Sericytochromatia bacterium]
MSEAADLSAERDRQTQLLLLKRKLKARDKVLLHLEQRLRMAPDNQHWLFLKDEHEKTRLDLHEQMRQLELERQGSHQLTQWVEGYLSHWEDADQEVLDPGESEAPTKNQALSAEQAHELETWQSLLRKVEARLLRLPGDPRLLDLRASHQMRIQALQNFGSEPAPIPTAAPPAPPPPLPEPLSEPPKTAALQGRSREQIEKELEIWAKLVKKSQERLAAKPELAHLRGMIAEHQAKMASLVAELAALPQENGN